MFNLSKCTLCPRECGADRYNAAGFCRSSASAHVARASLHFWEEPCISGKRGSGTIFFTGCNLQCVFCQNYTISTGHNKGKELNADQLCELFDKLVQEGAHNINLVNPTHFVPAIKDALRIWNHRVPVVYNSSGYETVETLRQIDGLVDIYLPDFKYADDKLAKRYSNAPDYAEVAVNAIGEMLRQTGTPTFDEDGMLQNGTIIRHLILPGCTRNSIAVLRSIERNFGKKALVSLMAQYVPAGKAAEFPEINRTITQEELERVSGELERLGLNGYVQELSSADSGFIPDFEDTGVLL